MVRPEDLLVTTLGPRAIPSPLGLSDVRGDGIADYTNDDARVLFEVQTTASAGAESPPRMFERAGPRQQIFFDPRRCRAAIVVCGGLCPGLNNVVRSLVLELFHKYGVNHVLGYRFGFSGMCDEAAEPPLMLTPEIVRHIHRQGGCILGLSRGARTDAALADALERDAIDVLFCVGGDGTLRGAHALSVELQKRGKRIGIVGIPKTVDNDIAFVERSFGYESAVEVARSAIDAAHTEATGTQNGVGVVKLMGRDAGFIAAAGTLASREVNYCLVPEVPFELDGPHGLLVATQARLVARGHAVIVVAEGCGASLPTAGTAKDASGNARYADADADIGPRLRDAIAAHLREAGVPSSVKYIDPSYTIRSVAANASDAIYCDALARNAVHAAMAGKTDIVIGYMHHLFTHAPLSLVTAHKRRVDPDGALWLAVTETTGQPRLVAPERRAHGVYLPESRP